MAHAETAKLVQGMIPSAAPPESLPATIAHIESAQASSGRIPPPHEALATTRVYGAALVLVLVGAFATRAAFVLTSDFPLYDGGLFLAMLEAVRASHYVLPDVVVYNGMAIPFAYPPLAFYVGSFAADAMGIALVDLLRLVPLVMSTLSVAAFALLAHAVVRDRVGTLVATAFV
ncbi:MAG: hypothetical protein QOF51_4229, partial [Chloroflexota bacterium]|nr:hypothetical protein [Chloroflexota bacterium]